MSSRLVVHKVQSAPSRLGISPVMRSCLVSSSSRSTEMPLSFEMADTGLLSSIGDFSSASRSGRMTMNVLPSPRRLSTRILPPIRETRRYDMARPSPNPGTLRAFSSRSKAVNILSVSLLSIPQPVSCTEKRSSPP